MQQVESGSDKCLLALVEILWDAQDTEIAVGHLLFTSYTAWTKFPVVKYCLDLLCLSSYVYKKCKMSMDFSLSFSNSWEPQRCS